MKCSIENCNLKSNCKTYCVMHYRRFLRHGDPLYVFSRKCSIKGCNNKHWAKNVCNLHWNRLFRNVEKHRATNRMWARNHPESNLKAKINQFQKLGKKLDMKSMEFSYALQSWSKTIKKLDNYMCKNCDSTENLNAHHIMPKADFPELSLDLDNGVTLCDKCHGDMHGFEIYSPEII